jgi:hypothetical protein
MENQTPWGWIVASQILISLAILGVYIAIVYNIAILAVVSILVIWSIIMAVDGEFKHR